MMNKPALIFSHVWSGIGEQMLTFHITLNSIEYIKSTYPNKFHIIYNIDDNRIGGTVMLREVLRREVFESVADEFYIGSIKYSHANLHNDRLDYVELIPRMVYIHKDSCTDEILEIFSQPLSTRVLPDNHFFMKFGWPDRGDICRQRMVYTQFKEYDILSDQINALADQFINDQFIDPTQGFEMIHFRLQPWPTEEQFGLNNDLRKEICLYWIERLASHIIPDTQYFASSNSAIFYQMLHKKFENIKFIDRGVAGWERYNELVSTGGMWEFPDIIPPDMFPSDADTGVISDFIAYIDCAISGKSNRVIHTTDGQGNRAMISLFIMYSAMIMCVPITWITEEDIIHRTYDIHGCKTHFKQHVPMPIPYKHPCYTPGYFND